jgi:restriction system protein
MKQIDSFHYPPELFELLVSTIPLLNKSKKSLLLFFRGAGIPEFLYKDISDKLTFDKDGINKYEIARTILARINEDTEKFIRERRELLKRVVEFESFTNCWESDQYKAKGLVAEIQKVVNVKDTFTRINIEREKEQAVHRDAYNKRVADIRKKKAERDAVKDEFYSLFGEENPNIRGKKLENALNRIFEHYEVLLKEAFSRRGEYGDGVIEQIDGVIEIDNFIFFVEMKWHKSTIGINDIHAHLGRIYHRAQAHGIYISASGYSPASINAAKEALLKNAILVLVDLQDFVNVLNSEDDLILFLRTKIKKAIIDKEPY